MTFGLLVLISSIFANVRNEIFYRTEKALNASPLQVPKSAVRADALRFIMWLPELRLIKGVVPTTITM